MATTTTIERPKRWNNPFDPEMSDYTVLSLLQRGEFASIDASRFPSQLPLAGILKNDCRIRRYRPGDLIVRDGDYGNSAFLVLEGDARVVFPPGLPAAMLGRSSGHKRGWFSAFSQLWTNRSYPEARRARDQKTYSATYSGAEQASLLDVKNPGELFTETKGLSPNMERLPPLVDRYPTAVLGPGMIFGEVAALGRVQRTATVYADTECELLEMRWQALRDIQRRDETWRELIEERYRSNQLVRQLTNHPFLAGLDEASLKRVAAEVLFETYGSFEWHRAFKDGGNQAEPLVAREGDYPDGLLLIGGGFGRVSMKLGNGRRTLTYLREGDHFGLDELQDAWRDQRDTPLETSLHALGYLHILRIPYHVLAEHVFPRIQTPEKRLRDAASRPIAADAFLEWTVQQRYINGTQAMLIDTEHCVRCDDCVRACSMGHGGNPRFIRQGNEHGRFMVANACMHCVDPVCMIGCPTGAIHRTVDQGAVVINDDSCIGCGTCANSCPYDNIRLVPIRDWSGRPLVDEHTKEPILKATKCDLCSSQIGGPACVRACPHDALRRVDFQTELANWREDS